jgi:hypothetical protein
MAYRQIRRSLDLQANVIRPSWRQPSKQDFPSFSTFIGTMTSSSMAKHLTISRPAELRSRLPSHLKFGFPVEIRIANRGQPTNADSSICSADAGILIELGGRAAKARFPIVLSLDGPSNVISVNMQQSLKQPSPSVLISDGTVKDCNPAQLWNRPQSRPALKRDIYDLGILQESAIAIHLHFPGKTHALP